MKEVNKIRANPGNQVTDSLQFFLKEINKIRANPGARGDKSMDKRFSQYLRAASELFFVFILLFSGMAQASVLQKMVWSLPDIPQSQIEEVFDILEDLNIRSWDLPESEEEVRVLVYALDDPTHLIKHSWGFPFNSVIRYNYGAFFFSRFDLHKDSDALFTKLFTREIGEEKLKLPFRDAQRNWENFIDALKKAEISYNFRFTKTDLEAAAISFIHQRLSDKSFSNPRTGRSSLNAFFNRKFTIAHYINPHFKLTWEDPRHQSIMMMISNGLFLSGENLSLINSKEFVLKIWSAVIQEIREVEYIGRTSTFTFLGLIADSIVKSRSSGSSMGGHDFLKAMEEAGREDDRLAKVVGIIENLVFQPGDDRRTIVERLRIEIMSLEL